MSVKKLAVPDASEGNTLVTHTSEMGCCGGDLNTCKYVALPTSGTAVTNVTSVTIEVNGVDTAFAFAAANTPKEIRMAIAGALRSAGYDPYYEDNYKGVQVVANEIHVIGQAPLKSVIINGGSKTFTEKCTMAGACSYSFNIPLDTDAGDLTINGIAGTAVGTGAGFATGEALDFKAAIIVALAADGVAYNLVNVTEGDDFTVTIDLIGKAEISLGIYDGTLTGCYPDFIV
jgi:hypothetical protein